MMTFLQKNVYSLCSVLISEEYWLVAFNLRLLFNVSNKFLELINLSILKLNNILDIHLRVVKINRLQRCAARNLAQINAAVKCSAVECNSRSRPQSIAFGAFMRLYQNQHGWMRPGKGFNANRWRRASAAILIYVYKNVCM